MHDQARHGQLRDERKARLVDLAVAVLFMLLGLYMAYASVVDYKALSQGQVGPGVLPLAIGLTFVLTSALIMLRLREPGLAVDPAEIPSRIEALRVLALVLLTIVTVLLMPVLGTLAALGLFAFVEVALLERRGFRLGVMTALILPALLYLLFEATLGVPLPAGRLGLL